MVFDGQGANCLLVKLLTSKPFNREALKATMSKLWRPSKSLRFHEMGSSVLMFDFEEKLDKERVIRGSPWLFDKKLFFMKEFEGQQ